MMPQNASSFDSSSPTNAMQTALFCTECYYKPGSCGNESGNTVHHVGTPLPSSPPSSGNILENLHVTSPTGSLARSIAQHQEEMKLLSLESMKKSVRNPQTSNQINSQSNLMKQSDILNSKDGTPELEIV